MKKLIVGFLVFGASVSFAASQTNMSSNWVCTTNASSSSVAADKAADDQMANSQSSASQSFAFAAQHCRDCTKITCEVKD